MSSANASTSASAVPTAVAGAVHRNFFDMYETDNATESGGAADSKAGSRISLTPAERSEALLSFIRQSLIGGDDAITTPFGVRRLTYADYTASGRALSCIEDYIRSEVLPLYANTHTLASATGMQSTLFRNEARSIVARSVRASKDDVIFFTGSGSTAGVNLLLHILRLKERVALASPAASPAAVVLVGPYEHHSNLLPWRESGARVIAIKPAATAGGDGLDLADLRARVKEFASLPAGCIKIGSFSACSNVTGILTDTVQVTSILKSGGFLSFWDYASAAPYVSIDMNPLVSDATAPTAAAAVLAKDALFFSPHKFVGGVSTPGVLAIKKSLLTLPPPTAATSTSNPPSSPGGGTVFFVSPDSHRYLQNFEEREEGGTPDIVAAIRCGLVFQLKEAVTTKVIHEKESAFCSAALKSFAANSNIVVLGDTSQSRLPIISFLIRAPNSKRAFLHSNFVSALLNDLFGVQSRSGCACAGPYAQSLLGIDAPTSAAFEASLIDQNEIVRPGFVRVNFNYFIDSTEFEFILSAIHFAANEGWKFLPQYGYITDSGEWKHRSRMTKMPDRRWLGQISYAGGAMAFKSQRKTEPQSALARYLTDATQLAATATAALSSAGASTTASPTAVSLTASAARLRWFMLPNDAYAVARGQSMDAELATAGSILPIAPHRVAETELKVAATATLSTSATAPATPTIQVSIKSTPPASQLDRDVKEERKSADTGARAGAVIRFPVEKFRTSKSKPTASAAVVVAAAPSKGSNVCRNCFHEHWTGTGAAPSHSLKCVSCSCVNFQPKAAKPTRATFQKLEDKLIRLVSQAILTFGPMIKSGDRVLIGVSGGKDSLTLFHILRKLQARSPVKFTIGCATVDPQTPEYDPSPLKKYFASLGVPYFYESQPILADAQTCMPADGKKVSICSFCSRMKRGILYSAMRREGYNVLALGQHLDDLAESFLMSAFFNGCLRTMKANYHAAKGDIRIIRPLAYCRERLTREFASLSELPVINENCPACYEAPKERQRVKLVLAEQEQLHPTLFASILNALHPLLALENYALPSTAGATAAGATAAATAAAATKGGDTKSSAASSPALFQAHQNKNFAAKQQRTGVAVSATAAAGDQKSRPSAASTPDSTAAPSLLSNAASVERAQRAAAAKTAFDGAEDGVDVTAGMFD